MFLVVEVANNKSNVPSSVSFWTGPSYEQEDGENEAAGRPQAAPELFSQPGVL